MKVGLIGGGSWGIALASILLEKGHAVLWWVHSESIAQAIKEKGRNPTIFPDFLLRLSNILYVGTDLQVVYQDSEVILVALPSAYVEGVLRQVKPPATPFLSATKGLVGESGLLPSVYLEQIGVETVGVLGGPSHAEEVIQNAPTWVALAHHGYDELVSLTRTLLEKATFQIIPTSHRTSLEWIGVLKNIYAIGMGAFSLWGDNARAALAASIQRELYEVLQEVAPTPLEVYLSPGWAGDFLVTAFSHHSRNQRFGGYLANGYTPATALQKLGGMVAEGYHTAQKVGRRLPNLGRYPILAVIIQVCTGERPSEDVLRVLLDRLSL